MASNNNLNQDGLHPVDVERLHTLKDMGAEEFTVRWQHKDHLLILKVNGVERNRIVLNYAEGKFNELLQWVKNQFILWRAKDN